MDYSEDLAIEKQPKMWCNWTIKSISYFLTGPKDLYLVPQARQEIEEAFVWYEERSLGLGLEFLRCVEGTIESIQQYPLMFPIALDEYRRAIIRRFPYTVFYEIESSRAVVHAVFHCSLDPQKWKARLTH